MNQTILITLSKTANGKQEYLQVLSSDMTVNFVLIADKFELRDIRLEQAERGKGDG